MLLAWIGPIKSSKRHATTTTTAITTTEKEDSVLVKQWLFGLVSNESSPSAVIEIDLSTSSSSDHHHGDIDVCYDVMMCHNKTVLLPWYLHLISRLLSDTMVKGLAVEHVKTHATELFTVCLQRETSNSSHLNKGSITALGKFIVLCLRNTDLRPVLIQFPGLGLALIHALQTSRYQDETVSSLCEAIAIIADIHPTTFTESMSNPECLHCLSDLLYRSGSWTNVFRYVGKAIHNLLVYHKHVMRRGMLEYACKALKEEGKGNFYVQYLEDYHDDQNVICLELLLNILAGLLCDEDDKDKDESNEKRDSLKSIDESSNIIRLDIETIETVFPDLIRVLQVLIQDPAISMEINIVYTMMKTMHCLLRRYVTRKPRMLLTSLEDNFVESLNQLQNQLHFGFIDLADIDFDVKRTEIACFIQDILTMLPLYHRPMFMEILEEELAKENLPEDDLGNFIICPITLKIMEDPVLLSDGHSYEREAIEHWLENETRSPKTNEELDVPDVVFPNRLLKLQITAYVKKKHQEKTYAAAAAVAAQPSEIKHEGMNMREKGEEDQVEPSTKKRKLEQSSSSSSCELVL
jgi:sacsin